MQFGAFQLMAHRRPTALGDLFRGAAVTQMAVVGIVFAILLRDVDLGARRPWVSRVLHTVMPIAVVLEWRVAPPQTKLGFQQLLQVQIFPRLCGLHVNSGSHDRLGSVSIFNPENVGGYAGVAAYSAAIAAVCFVISWLLFKSANKLNRIIQAKAQSPAFPLRRAPECRQS